MKELGLDNTDTNIFKYFVLNLMLALRPKAGYFITAICKDDLIS